MGEDSAGVNVFDDLWGLAKQRISGIVTAKNAADTFDSSARYGIDELGQPFLRGKSTTVAPLGLGSMGPVLLLGGALLAATLVVVWALKD
jgi:hypothetical protein